MMTAILGRTRSRRIGLVVLCALGTLWASPAVASTGIKTGGNVLLTEDHYGTVVLTGDYAYLDCQGHSIYNSNQASVCWTDNRSSYFRCGVHVDWGSDVDIKRCNIEGFPIGINMVISDDVWVYNSTLVDNTEGLRAYFTDGIWTFNTDFHFSSQAISIRESWGVKFSSNDVWWSDGDGIDVNFSSGFQLLSNVIRDNMDHNVEIDDSSYVTCDDNNIDGERVSDSVDQATNSDNLQLEDVNQIWVRNNFMRDAGRHGLYVRNVTGGTVSGNNVYYSGNQQTGYDCRHRNSSGVTYSSNSFGTTYGGCT